MKRQMYGLLLATRRQYCIVKMFVLVCFHSLTIRLLQNMMILNHLLWFILTGYLEHQYLICYYSAPVRQNVTILPNVSDSVYY